MKSNSDQNVNASVFKFFDSLSNEYTGLIERCVPRYGEMISTLMNYIPKGLHVKNVLELGCGTGNLSVGLAAAFPSARIRFVDISPEMQNKCRARLGPSERFAFEVADFRAIDYASSSFDLVVSTISLHHLKSAEKVTLFKRIHLWLRAGGVFTYSDQFSGATPDLNDRHMQNWKREAMNLGATQDDWDVWMKHQSEYDHHDSLPDQINWLTAAGFSTVDCPWRFLLWTVLQASR